MQLTDLNLKKRLGAIELKADLIDKNSYSILQTNHKNTNKENFHSLLATEEAFFLLNPNILSVARLIASLGNDKKSLKQLQALKLMKTSLQQEKLNEYILKEQFKRGFRFDLEDYLEMLTLDDLLLKEVEYDYIIDSPYLFHSISYLKNIFKDYYQENIEADSYLYTILQELKSDPTSYYYNFYQIERTLNLFTKEKPKEKRKIITLSTRKM